MNEHHPNKSAIIHRLRSIAGHVKSVERMVEQDQYCVDVLRQLLAIQTALSGVRELVLADHLQSCVTTAIRGDDPAERERVLHELIDVMRHE